MWNFRVLGPLEVAGIGSVVPLGATRQRRLLAALVMRVGRPVALSTLIDAVWESTPPRTAAPTVQSYVSRLRTALGTGTVTRAGSSYLLQASPGCVDAYRFEEHLGSARRASAPEQAVALLDDALGFWAGEPYPELGHHGPAVVEAARLVELQVVAREMRAEARLAAGDAATAVAELRGLTTEYPLREAGWHALMVALHNSGRQPEALEAFRVYDRLLAEEGLEPSAALRTAHTAILSAPESALGPTGRWRDSPTGRWGVGPVSGTGVREGRDARRPTGAADAPTAPRSGPLLVGRDREWAIVDEARAEAQDGRGGAVFLIGEPGIGKSRLAAALTHSAATAGMCVLRGRASTILPTVALRPLAEAVGPLFRTGPLFRAGAVPTADGVGALLPLLGPLVPGGKASSPGPVAIAEALLRLTALVGGPAGCVLMLDDLHDADPETLAVTEYLVDNLPGQRTLLVAAVRPHRSKALDLAYSAGSRRAATVVELGPLDSASVAELVAERIRPARDRVSPDFVDRIVTRSGGNPFYVEELLLSGLPAGGTDPTVPDDPAVVPPAIVRTIVERSRALGTGGQELLSAAAVFGDRFPLPVVEAMTAIGAGESHQLVKAAIDANLLMADDAGPVWYRFRHALTAVSLVTDLAPLRRIELAGLAADAIEKLHPDLAGDWCRLAAVMRRRGGATSAAGRLLLEAGRRAAAAGATEAAAAMLEEAVQLVADDAELQVEILEPLLHSLADAGQFRRATEYAQRLDRVAGPRLDHGRRAAVHTRLAWVANVAGHWQKGMDHVRVARTLLPAEAGDALTAPLDMVEAYLTLELPGPDRTTVAGNLARRATGAAARASLPVVECQGWQLLGVLARARSIAEATECFTRSLRVAERERLPVWRMQATIRLGGTDALLDGCTVRLEQARADAQALGALTAWYSVESFLTLLDVLGGRYDRSAERIDAALPPVTRMEMVDLGQYLLLCRATSFAHRGDRPAMERALIQFGARGGRSSAFQPLALGLARAFCALLEEDRALARSELTAARAAEAENPTIFHLAGRHGLELLLGVIDGDMGWAAHDDVRSAQGGHLRWNRQFIHYSHAVLLGRAGRGDEAVAAVAAAEEAGRIYPTARHLGLRLVAGAALADAWGDPGRWSRDAQTYFAAVPVPAVAATCRAMRTATT